MINTQILELLKTCIPGMESCENDEENGSFIVTVPQADSMFFREFTENPILQRISTFKKLGVSFDPQYAIDEENKTLTLFYLNEKSSSHDDWRILIECDGDWNKNVEDGDELFDILNALIQ